MRTAPLLCFLFVTLLGCSTDSGDPVNPTPPDDTPPAAEGDLMTAEQADGGTSDGGACLPDLASSVTCGRCGTAAVMCVAGQPQTGACMGEHGECAAGQILTSSDGCMMRTCKDNCSGWGYWTLKPPAVCGYNQGDTMKCAYRGCGLNDEGRRKCLPGCKWGPCECI